jgi:hypothetical protein
MDRQTIEHCLVIRIIPTVGLNVTRQHRRAVVTGAKLAPVEFHNFAIRAVHHPASLGHRAMRRLVLLLMMACTKGDENEDANGKAKIETHRKAKCNNSRNFRI